MFAVLWCFRAARAALRVSACSRCSTAVPLPVEFVREPDAHIGYLASLLTMGQVLSTPLVLVGCTGCVFRARADPAARAAAAAANL